MDGEREPESMHDYRIETWAEPTHVEKFAAKYGCADPGDTVTFAAWLASPLPKSQALRRLAALYLMELRGVTCELCGLDIDPALEREPRHPGRVQLDHIIPSSGSGSDTWGNVRPTHATCNTERRDERVPSEAGWLRDLLSAERDAYEGRRTRASVAIMRADHYAARLAEVTVALNRERAAERPDEDRLNSLLRLPFEYRNLEHEWRLRARRAEA
ncbi:MAG: HNH endonuclease [Actinobacteria bacterium]|nr:HNH endonuclease [Actinomycetota bacterium]MBU1609477.1 HNH endonuclease [Actinomycetota bacterium]MBU2315243.1 HNH endonuclease [Actinomycetota bacterium]MBU2386327.1 HNH endonuclease [Actinomycetota bacterium]